MSITYRLSAIISQGPVERATRLQRYVSIVCVISFGTPQRLVFILLGQKVINSIFVVAVNDALYMEAYSGSKNIFNLVTAAIHNDYYNVKIHGKNVLFTD